MTISQDAVTRALSKWVFRHVWNQPPDESVATIRLMPAAPRFVTNAILTSRGSIPLPRTGRQFAAFWVDVELTREAVIIPPDTWVAADQLGARHRILFHVYGETGLMLPKAAVYLYHPANGRMVYVAVERAPLVAIVGMAAWNELYLGIYRYAATGPSPLSIASFRIADPDPTNASAGMVRAAIASAVGLYPHGTFVYVNGYDYAPSASIPLAPGDYVDVYTDATVFGLYSVDLSTAITGFFSVRDMVYKEVLHCPKAVNPGELIMTSDQLTLTARRNSDGVGSFIHHNEPNGITQVTHNDIAIHTHIVNAYRTSLGTQDISIEVRLRSHGLTLIRDRNFIDYLYLCDDDTILGFLTGKGDPTLPFWTAAALEQCAYVGYMTTPPQVVSPETLASYIAGLGYYTVLAAICQHDRWFVVDQLPVNGVSVFKPRILAGLPAYPLVYLDGIKLREDEVHYTNSRHNKIVFSIVPSATVALGQTLTVELIETGPSTPYLFTPTALTPTLTVPFGGVSVYQVNPLAEPVIAYEASSSTSYIAVPVGPGSVVQAAPTPAGETLVTFQPAAHGQTYLIQNTTFSRRYGLDITADVQDVKPIHIELTTLCNAGPPVVPLLGYRTLAVFLNGKRLIEGIDYAAKPVTDAAGNTAIAQVMITNRSALDLRGANYLEVIAHTATPLVRAVGYVANGMINIQNNVETWYSGLTTAFAGGVLQISPIDAGDAILPAQPVGNGTPFLLTADIPNVAAEVLAGFSPTADDRRIGVINTYLNQQPPINDVSALIIPRSWQVFSPFLAAVVHDAIQAGTVQLYASDTDPVLFRRQFAAYDYLLLNDPTLDPVDPTIDRRFCDIFPTYARVTVPDLGTRAAIRRLAELLLPTEIATLGEVLDA